MSVINSIPLIAAGDDGYQISRSVRLRASAQAYLDRTFSTPTDGKKWTYSLWMKKSKDVATAGHGSSHLLTTAGSGAQGFLGFGWNNSGDITFGYGGYGRRYTNGIYRDPSAWYHIVVAVDTSQATEANRALLYVNGASVAWATNTAITQNDTTQINQAVATNIGRQTGQAYESFDGLFTEMYFIDGQQLTASSFGETDAVTGVWKPKKYAGTYGTNGFYLNFSDNSSNTAATIGKDSSGNGNNWTPNNISVTAGVTYDSMIDTPTPYADGGNGRGNYCVINPLDTQNASSVAQGNQYISFSAVNYGHSRATMSIPDSSYWEVVAGGSAYLTLGVANSTAFSSWNWSGSWAIYQSDGKVYNSAAAITGVLATFTTNDVIGFAVKGNKLYIAKNGTWLNSGDPVAGTGSVASSLPSEIFPYIGNGGGAAGTPSAYFNAGQSPFAYTPPTGFKALNTQNLPDATIKKGNAYFDATTFTSNGTTQTVTNNGGMQPDLLWIKSRSNTSGNYVTDSSRGSSLYLVTNSTAADVTDAQWITSLNSNGFSIGTNNLSNGWTNVAWQWKESASAGFDIVTYTGDGTTAASRLISHSLGVTPSFIITKKRSSGTDYGWSTWHKSLGGDGIWLDKTSAKNVGMWDGYSNFSSTVFTPPDLLYGNESGATYINYVWAEVAGYSAFGSYTGNGSTDGPFVYLGFRPRFVLIKRTDSTSDWNLMDTSRDPYNAAVAALFPNGSYAETTGYNKDILSNGFKLRDSGASTNASGGTYIYAAFAENPFKNALAR